MTIKNLYPKSRPQNIYNVINGRPELPAASTFSRASEATYTDANGIIKTAAIDKPRFNYDPETGEFLGLMLTPQRKNIIGYNITFFGGKWVTRTGYVTTPNAGVSPDGTQNATLHETNVNGNDTVYLQSTFYDITGTGALTVLAGAWVKAVSANCRYTNFRIQGDYPTRMDITYDWLEDRMFTGTRVSIDNYDIRCTKYPNGWVHLTAYARLPANNIGANYPKVVFASSNDQTRVDGVNGEDTSQYLWGVVVEKRDEPTLDLDLETVPMIYSEGVDASTTTEADTFSLTSSSNFDGGFSLLLDSESTTDDYFYKIKASGTTIAELNNANGTLDWVINGVSAAINGEYPQVGAIQPGRVRTISSFGAADGTTQQNYLYTEGLSFPTNAIVASGADEVEFGPGQTLKAVYLWNGQLSNTEAVSVIKGEYNIVPNEPIKADSYSFVYNTDPTTVGEATITLPYIVPTVSMRVYWGDGTDSSYAQGVIASHTYPYPGQYRIQIVADDGFDAARLGDVDRSIYRVDQWAPQYRVGATGDGFTGDGLSFMLNYQTRNEIIPPFKYTNLTDLSRSFYAQVSAQPNNWDWVPTELQQCTTLDATFDNVSRDTGTQIEFNSFPQLQTSSSLTSVNACFTNCRFEYFDNDISGLPFTVTSSVTRWDGCFANMVRLLRIGDLDTSAATNLTTTFSGCSSLAVMPFIATNNVTSFQSTWQNCSSLTSFPQLNTSNGTNFSSAWYGCNNLTSFPLTDTSSGTNFSSTWSLCGGLTTIPNLNFDSATKLDGAWQSSGLTAFPRLDFPLVTSANSAWRSCSSLVSFPANTTFPVCANFVSAWRGCNKFTSFPPLDLSSATGLGSAWRGCASLTSFPKLNVSSGSSFANAWDGCTSLASFPDDNSQDMFNTTGVLGPTAFNAAFADCALTAQSIENILVSLDANGASNIQLGIDGGTNAAKSTWTAAAITAFNNLAGDPAVPGDTGKGWAITFNP